MGRHFPQDFQNSRIGDGPIEDPSNPSVLECPQNMSGVPGAVRVITNRNRGGSVGHGLAHNPGGLIRLGVLPEGELLPDPPEELIHVVSDVIREFLIVIGHDMDRGPDVGDIGPGIAIEDTDKGTFLPRLPTPSPLHDIHRGGGSSPLEDRGRDDSRPPGCSRGGVRTFHSHMKSPGRSGTLKGRIVMGIPLGRKGEIGPFQKLGILVPVQIEAGGDRYIGPHDLSEPAGDLCLGPGNVPHGHGPVESQVDTIHGKSRLKILDHQVQEVVECFFRVPTPGGTAKYPKGGRQADQFHVAIVFGHGYEPADVPPSSEKCFPSHRRTDLLPVFHRYIASGTEGAGLMGEGGNSYPEGLQASISAGVARAKGAHHRENQKGN